MKAVNEQTITYIYTAVDLWDHVLHECAYIGTLPSMCLGQSYVAAETKIRPPLLAEMGSRQILYICIHPYDMEPYYSVLAT